MHHDREKRHRVIAIVAGVLLGPWVAIGFAKYVCWVAELMWG